nr:hypothetical protein [Xanthomonas fragariae]
MGTIRTAWGGGGGVGGVLLQAASAKAVRAIIVDDRWGIELFS